MQGVDEQIKNRMDAFRGKEPQLAQRYQASQELLDLLALQKLKSEKDQVATQMQMQMQNNPQTIKQQREAEMMTASKQDIAKGVMGALQQKQAQQQANIQRVASNGVAAGAPTTRMAEGGIVGFAPGGSALSSPDRGYSVGYDRAYYEEVERIRNDDTMSAEDKNKALAALDAQAAQAEAAYQKSTTPDTEDGLMLEQGDLVMPDMTNVPQGGTAIPEDAIEVDYSSNPFTETASTGIASLATADPNAAFDATYDKQLDLRKRTAAETADVKNLQTERKGIEQAILNPDKLSRDSRLSTLIGMAGKSTLGLTGAGGAAGQLNAQRTQELARSKLFGQREDSIMDELNKSQDIRATSAAQAQTAYSDASADRRAGVSAASTMATGYDAKLTAEADRNLKLKVANNNTAEARRAEAIQTANKLASNANKILVTNIATQLSSLRTEVERERNSIAAQGNMYQYLTTAMANVSAKITSAETTLRDAANTALLEIDNNTAMDDDKKADAKLEIRNQLQNDIQAATADATKLLNQLMKDQQNAAGQINTKTTSGGSRQFKVIR